MDEQEQWAGAPCSRLRSTSPSSRVLHFYRIPKVSNTMNLEFDGSEVFGISVDFKAGYRCLEARPVGGAAVPRPGGEAGGGATAGAFSSSPPLAWERRRHPGPYSRVPVAAGNRGGSGTPARGCRPRPLPAAAGHGGGPPPRRDPPPPWLKQGEASRAGPRQGWTGAGAAHRRWSSTRRRRAGSIQVAGGGRLRRSSSSPSPAAGRSPRAGSPAELPCLLHGASTATAHRETETGCDRTTGESTSARPTHVTGGP